MSMREKAVKIWTLAGYRTRTGILTEGMMRRQKTACKLSKAVAQTPKNLNLASRLLPIEAVGQQAQTPPATLAKSRLSLPADMAAITVTYELHPPQDTHVRLQSGEVRKVLQDCVATIGRVSNPLWRNRNLGKAGRSRWLGRRPSVRGMAMNRYERVSYALRTSSHLSVQMRSPSRRRSWKIQG